MASSRDGASLETREMQRLNRQFERLARQLADRTQANKAASLKLYQFVIRNIDEGGKLVAGKWAPLALSTVKYKRRIGKTKPGIITGQMRASFVPFHDRQTASVGSALDYAEFFNSGTFKQPARPLVPSARQSVQIAIEVYKNFVNRSSKEAFRK